MQLLVVIRQSIDRIPSCSVHIITIDFDCYCYFACSITLLTQSSTIAIRWMIAFVSHILILLLFFCENVLILHNFLLSVFSLAFCTAQHDSLGKFLALCAPHIFHTHNFWFFQPIYLRLFLVVVVVVVVFEFFALFLVSFLYLLLRLFFPFVSDYNDVLIQFVLCFFQFNFLFLFSLPLFSFVVSFFCVLTECSDTVYMV